MKPKQILTIFWKLPRILHYIRNFYKDQLWFNTFLGVSDCLLLWWVIEIDQ